MSSFHQNPTPAQLREERLRLSDRASRLLSYRRRHTWAQNILVPAFENILTQLANTQIRLQYWHIYSSPYFPSHTNAAITSYIQNDYTPFIYLIADIASEMVTVWGSCEEEYVWVCFEDMMALFGDILQDLMEVWEVVGDEVFRGQMMEFWRQTWGAWRDLVGLEDVAVGYAEEF